MGALFVYGTLRAGQPARPLLAPHIVEHVPAMTRGRLVALSGGYPGLLDDPGRLVVGELVVLRDTDHVLALLDDYEGAEYLRVQREISPAGRGHARAWCYVLRDPRLAQGCPVIESGDWLIHVRRQIEP